MSQIGSQTPLKGIPFGASAPCKAAKPLHLEGPLPNCSDDSFEACGSKAQGVGPAGRDTPETRGRGLLDWLFGSADSAPEALPEPTAFKLGKADLKGHLASDGQHANYPSARYEIRTYMSTPQGQAACVDFRDLAQALSVPALPSQNYVVSAEQVGDALQTSDQERQSQLDHPERLHDGRRVVPKDSSLNPGNVTMYLRSRSDVSTRYVQQLSEIGKIEGFHMVAGIAPGQASSFASALKDYDNISLMEAPYGEVWTEDYSEPTVGGGQVIPALFHDDTNLVQTAIREGREERYRGTGLSGDFAYHGAVNHGKYQKLAAARATAAHEPLRQALSYMEGGNIYTGSRPNGDGYVLVGKDSFAVTRRLLEKQTGHSWTEAEVKKVIAADLGLKLENVVPIEQPAAFHLDMRMTAIAPGEIILNDAVKACEQQLSWMKGDIERELESGKISRSDADSRLAQLERQATKMRDQARSVKPYEDMCEADLKAAGFKVDRVGGQFVDPKKPSRDTANYFNARHFTNEQGERVTILMGGQSREEAYMAQTLFDLSHGDISRIHFMDPTVTQQTLDLWGGLKCRTKPEGDLVSSQLLAQPAHAQLQTA